LQTGLSRRHGWLFFRLCQEIPVRYKKAFNRAIKDYHLYLLISFDLGDNLIQWSKVFGAENAHRRKVKGNSPVRGRASFKTDVGASGDSHSNLLVGGNFFVRRLQSRLFG
jgi:hypothetical protein